MGWQAFFIKHGIGSPGYIAKKMAKQYRAIRVAFPEETYRSVLRRLFATRVVAQSSFGGPEEYRAIRDNFSLLDLVVDRYPNLYAVIRYSILVEHPEFQNPFAPADRFEVLDRVIAGVLDREVPEWRELPVSWASEASASISEEAVTGAPDGAESRSAITVRPQCGDSVEAALRKFADACREPGTLFITDEWMKPRFQQLEALLTDPITSEEAESLCDAIMKRAKLDQVIEWLVGSTLPWRDFIARKQDFEDKAKALNSALERIEYERQRSEAEMAWRTKGNTPWEAAMRDTVLQAEHDPEPVRREFGHMASPCPQCGSTDLTWFYYIEPPHSYELRWGPRFAGWVTACEQCNVAVNYLGTLSRLRVEARGFRVMD